MLLEDMEEHTTPVKTNVEIKTALAFPPRKHVPGHHYNMFAWKTHNLFLFLRSP